MSFGESYVTAVFVLRGFYPPPEAEAVPGGLPARSMVAMQLPRARSLLSGLAARAL